VPNPKATPSFDEALAAAAGGDKTPDVSFEDALATAAPQQSQPGSKAGLIMSAAAAASPYIQQGASAFGNSSAVPKIASRAANNLTQVAAIVRGAATMNPVDVLAAPREGWIAGKGAYWLTRGLAQPAARGVATVLDAVAPYAQTLSTLSGAQGLLDLAQTAEPNRQDIGTLGVSVGQPRSDAEKTAHPALLNMLASKVRIRTRWLNVASRNGRNI
jgi:hypothetical protein